VFNDTRAAHVKRSVRMTLELKGCTTMANSEESFRCSEGRAGEGKADQTTRLATARLALALRRPPLQRGLEGADDLVYLQVPQCLYGCRPNTPSPVGRFTLAGEGTHGAKYREPRGSTLALLTSTVMPRCFGGRPVLPVDN
jgi:hypothetical protein